MDEDASQIRAASETRHGILERPNLLAFRCLGAQPVSVDGETVARRIRPSAPCSFERGLADDARDAMTTVGVTARCRLVPTSCRGMRAREGLAGELAQKIGIEAAVHHFAFGLVPVFVDDRSLDSDLRQQFVPP